jgi:hypothetical protein
MMRALATIEGVAMIGAVAVAGVIAWQVVKQGKTIAAAAGEALDQVNPLNNNNVFKQGADSAFQAVTGDKVNTIGTRLAEVFDPTTRAAADFARSLTGTADTGPTIAQLLNTPADQEDADLGAAIRGFVPWSVADQEDAEAGKFPVTMQVTPGFSYLTRKFTRPTL